jgi:DNA-binding CsgD family transcriptional regulator
MHLSRFSRRPLSLIVTPWRPDAVENSKRSAAILLVGDPEKETVIPAKVLSLLYGLTPAEARLALALLNGNSLAEAAELHGTSELTARTQLKTVFQKTDTRRQAELVRLLAGLQLSRALPGGRLKRASTLYEG